MNKTKGKNGGRRRRWRTQKATRTERKNKKEGRGGTEYSVSTNLERELVHEIDELWLPHLSSLTTKKKKKKKQQQQQEKKGQEKKGESKDISLNCGAWRST